MKKYKPGFFRRRAECALDNSKHALPHAWKTQAKDLKFTRLGPRSYVLNEDAFCMTEIEGSAAQAPFIELTQEGVLTVKAGYQWDGPSGPTFDSHDSLPGSLFHDALYDLHERHKVGGDLRNAVDELAYRCWRADGMRTWRAELWHKALKSAAWYFWFF